MHFRVVPFLLLMLVPFNAGQGNGTPAYATWSFGVSLATGAHSQLYSLFLVQEYQMEVIRTEPIGTEQFLMQAQGFIESKANPKAENLFLKYRVLECLNPVDTLLPMRYCGVFDRLWKLRFWEYPFKVQQGVEAGRGWAENREAPSQRQMLLLTEFGIDHLTGLSYGDQAFALLKAMSDSAWIDNYRKGY